MFPTDFDFEEPLIGSDLLAEIGLQPGAVRDVIDDDRARRCPDPGTPAAEILSPSPPC